MDNFMEVVNQPAMIRATFEPSSSGVLEQNSLPTDGEVRANGPKKVTVVIMERWEVMGGLLSAGQTCRGDEEAIGNYHAQVGRRTALRCSELNRPE